MLLLTACGEPVGDQENVLYQGLTFTVHKDGVIQGENVAEVLSPTHLRSNYQSPASATFPRLIPFKFSINEKDNELPPGQDHWVVIGADEHESPIIRFGETPAASPDPPTEYLPTNYEYTFRVDVSAVLSQFAEQGYYEAFDGSRVAEADFKGIYVAGAAEPLSWDFVNLDNKGLKLEPTEDPNIYSLTVVFNPHDESASEVKEWEPVADISDRPSYTSDQPLVDALFNLSLDEAIQNIEADSTLRTGAKWGGVWTRDVSYSILLAFAYHEPEVAKISLRRKVNRGRIIQDTGSGGAWPVSSDRTTWVLAAWEIYKITGDQEWLDEVYPIIQNTLEDDYQTIYDPNTGLYSGESSFLDWREQTYPKWMDNRDIYVSHNLGTNVVHYQAHRILAEIARIKGEPFELYDQRAEAIKAGINNYLWLEDEGYYAQFLYGRSELIRSPRYEALGEALAILFGVADDERAASIIGRSPLTEYGATCIYPQIPGIPPYHNNGIWPFVQSYWNWAAAKTGNEAVLNHGLASIYRAAGLFLTNYENMVAETGDFLGTEINSHRMLWSMAGNLAMVHRVFMGMEFEMDGIRFQPNIPAAYGGTRQLNNFRYREAILDIEIIGHGTEVAGVTLDGEPAEAFFPADLSGRHKLVITMANNEFPHQEINLVANHFSPATVLAERSEYGLSWQTVEGAREYRIYRNGELLETTTETSWPIQDATYASYMISAVDERGYEGFAAEPLSWSPKEQIIELEQLAEASPLPYTNYSGSGFIELSRQHNLYAQIPVTVDQPGTYLLDFRYANGSGRWNTDNKCAIRSLYLGDVYQGVIVMPQRGMDEWSDWGYTNSIAVQLEASTQQLTIAFEDWNNNMNVEVNRAMLDFLRIRYAE